MTIKNELKPLSFFNSSGYDISYLDVYMNNFVLNSEKNQNAVDAPIVLLPLKTTFARQFGIECLLSTKIIDVFCRQALEDVTNVIPLYDLSQDYDGLLKVSKAVQ